MARRSSMPSKGRHVYAAGARGRSLVLFGEISTGVAGCPSTAMVFGGWQATTAVVRPSLAVEKSAEAVLPAGSLSLGRAEREAECQDIRARGRRFDRSQPLRGPGREGLRVKPDDARPERSDGSAPNDTAAHPAGASLWEQF